MNEAEILSREMLSIREVVFLLRVTARALPVVNNQYDFMIALFMILSVS